MDSAVSAGALAVPRYQISRQDCTSHVGGVITYIKEDIRPEQLVEPQTKYVNESLEATITKILVYKPNRSIIVIGVYRPPSRVVPGLGGPAVRARSGWVGSGPEY